MLCMSCVMAEQVSDPEELRGLKEEDDSKKNTEDEITGDDNNASRGVKAPCAPTSMADFADAIEYDSGLPDAKEQADAMRAFGEGKLTYAQMRELCG